MPIFFGSLINPKKKLNEPMKLIIGFFFVSGCVLGGFMLSHGKPLALWQPYELLIIGGAAFGAFIIANPAKVIKTVFRSVPLLFKGSKFTKALYLDLLGLMYDLFVKSRKDGLMALETDIELPKQSAIFKKYPRIVADHHMTEFICDYLRLMVGGNMNVFELENLMEVELDTHHQEASRAPHALTKVSDGLPGFGIVAAVLGIVITMAAMLEHLAEEESKFFECIKVCLIATLNGYAPQIAVEFGRKAVFSSERPSFTELESHIKNKAKKA
jgi:chemotaxis protein MotA